VPQNTRVARQNLPLSISLEVSPSLINFCFLFSVFRVRNCAIGFRSDQRQAVICAGGNDSIAQLLRWKTREFEHVRLPSSSSRSAPKTTARPPENRVTAAAVQLALRARRCSTSHKSARTSTEPGFRFWTSCSYCRVRGILHLGMMPILFFLYRLTMRPCDAGITFNVYVLQLGIIACLQIVCTLLQFRFLSSVSKSNVQLFALGPCRP